MGFGRFGMICVLMLSVASLFSAAAERPHIVLILADDLGWGDVGFHGSDIKTPSIDQLAMAGARLEAFYVQPVCSPTRAALMTGRYPMRHGLQVGVVRPWAEYGLPLEERTLPSALKAAGYTTAICGKWHLGHFQPAYLPTRRGFDHQYGHYNGALDYFTHMRDGGFDWHRNDQVCRDEGYATHLLAQESARLIEQHDAAKPLFLYVPFNAVHTPLQVPEKYLQPYSHLAGPRQKYAGMLAAMDEAIGQIMAAIDKKGIRSNTLVIFSSDNGGPDPGRMSSNGPLRAGKGTLYEGGTRVAAFATWPGQIPAGSTVTEPLHIVDWYPTLVKLAGGSLDQPLPLDGRDAWPTITEGKPSPHDTILLNTTPNNGALRAGDWKLVVNGARSEIGPEPSDAEKANTSKKQSKKKVGNANAKGKGNKKETAAPTVELFNLTRDPYEKVNLADKHPEKVAELRARLDEFASQAIPPKSAPMAANFKSPKIWGEPEEKATK
jgi:arylsulfatase A-like enzyme